MICLSLRLCRLIYNSLSVCYRKKKTLHQQSVIATENKHVIQYDCFTCSLKQAEKISTDCKPSIDTQLSLSEREILVCFKFGEKYSFTLLTSSFLDITTNGRMFKDKQKKVSIGTCQYRTQNVKCNAPHDYVYSIVVHFILKMIGPLLEILLRNIMILCCGCHLIVIMLCVRKNIPNGLLAG